MESVDANDRPKSRIIDTAIVGAGPAGLSAALFLTRAGRSVVAFDGGPSRITVVDQVRELIGFDGMSPHEMLECMRNEVVRMVHTFSPEGFIESILARMDYLMSIA
jgi:thioredoxin reductase